MASIICALTLRWPKNREKEKRIQISAFESSSIHKINQSIRNC